MANEPGTAVTVPSQSLLKALGDATTRPAGRLSVKAIPVRVTGLLGATRPQLGSAGSQLGLVMVKLSKDVPPCTVVAGTNSLLMVGGLATIKVADAVPPVPPLVELTAPVLFKYEPVGVAVTFTVTWQAVLTAMEPPVKETMP